MLALLLLLTRSGVSFAAADFAPGYFVENAGQFDARARFRGEAGGAAVWLADDAVWLMIGGNAVRLGFGTRLVWEPVNPLGTRFNFYGAEGWFEGVPAWGAVRAALAEGVSLTVSGDGLWVSGDSRGRAVNVTLSGAQIISGEGGPLRVSLPGAGERALPLGGAVPVLVNGQPVGDGAFPKNEAAGAQLVWGTYIGGVAWDEAEGLAVDAAGRVYVAGETLSLFFPTAAGEAALHAVESFVGRLSADGSTLEYISVFTADVEDWGGALAIDTTGNAYAVGRTDSSNFPVTAGAYDETPNGNFDVFAMKLDGDGQLVYATLLGGGEDDFAGGLAVDGGGSAWLAGGTYSDGLSSAIFPTTANAYDATPNGGRDAFVARLSANGSALLYSTFAGGSGNDHVEALALRGGAAVAAGWTTSADFAVPAGGYDTVKTGPFDAFTFALTPSAATLDFWTYLGGDDTASVTGERALALALDVGGNLIIAGSTGAADFPATVGAFDLSFGGGSDGFVAKISANGASLLWATYLGDAADDEVAALQLTSTGDVILGGFTGSVNFPVSPDAFDAALGGLTDGFLARLTGSGVLLPYATFLGGGDDDRINAVWSTPAGRVYAAGWSDSPDFPTTPGTYDPNWNADKDAVIAVLLPPLPVLPLRIYLPVVTSPTPP